VIDKKQSKAVLEDDRIGRRFGGFVDENPVQPQHVSFGRLCEVLLDVVSMAANELR
jgi:hypothetical protein